MSINWDYVSIVLLSLSSSCLYRPPVFIVLLSLSSSCLHRPPDAESSLVSVGCRRLRSSYLHQGKTQLTNPSHFIHTAPLALISALQAACACERKYKVHQTFRCNSNHRITKQNRLRRRVYFKNENACSVEWNVLPLDRRQNIDLRSV